MNNPFINIPGYNCFGCSPSNPHGLQMTFNYDGQKVVSIWEPKEHFQGYGNVLHGGIQTTLMDEIASWIVFAQCKTAGVTKQLHTEFLQPVFITKGDIYLTAEITDQQKSLVQIETTLSYLNEQDKILSKATVEYFIYPQGLAKKKLKFPEYEEFFAK